MVCSFHSIAALSRPKALYQTWNDGLKPIRSVADGATTGKVLRVDLGTLNVMNAREAVLALKTVCGLPFATPASAQLMNGLSVTSKTLLASSITFNDWPDSADVTIISAVKVDQI